MDDQVGDIVFICPGCGQRVDPNDADTDYGVRLLPAPSMTSPNDVIEGLGDFFHPGHLHAGYRRKPKPEV